MPANYAGALAAIKTKFAAEWTSTPIEYVNAPFDAPVDGSNQALAWVFFEVVSTGSFQLGRGTPGNSVIVYDGLIKAHVIAPINSGVDYAMGLAVDCGEIFRNELFYDTITPGCHVRTGINGPPRIEQGDALSDNDQEFIVTATIPFEYWHRA
jgi:hypothetical protein